MTFDPNVDSIIQFVKQICGDYLQVQKCWFFGSRASGSAGTTSDFDFAFEWKATEDASWGEFANLLRERNPTLYSLDIVRVDQVDDQLKNRIISEGRIIYEKPAAKNRQP